MKFLACAGAGNVEETLVLGVFAFAMAAFEPGCERVDVLATGGDGGQQDGRGGVVIGLKVIEDRPGEQAAETECGAALERRNEDEVPFKALGFVDSEQFYEAGVSREGFRLGIELRKTVFEKCGIDVAGRGFEGVEELKEALGVGEFGCGKRRVSSKGTPGAFYELGGCDAGARVCGGDKDCMYAGEALP